MKQRRLTTREEAQRIAEELKTIISKYMKVNYPEHSIEEHRLEPEEWSWGTAYDTYGFDIRIEYNESDKYLDKTNEAKD